MTKGLPASGKSTWAKERAMKSGGNIKRINKDDLRDMLDGGKWSRGNEKNIIQVRDLLVEHHLAAGSSVIVDDTNLSPKHEKRLKELAANNGAEFVVKSFLDVSVAECIKRDLARPSSVGERVINSMFNQFVKPQPVKYEHDFALPTAIICDIDGTLAHMRGRDPHDYTRVSEDSLDPVVAELLERYWEEPEMHILLVSGRPELCREDTVKWLDRHQIGRTELLMRATGDYRNDTIVKKEIFENHIRENYNVLFVLDDRNRVVDMWRNELGLKVLQVAEGDF